MKSLFFMILSLVFVLVNLIAPNLFTYDLDSYLPAVTVVEETAAAELDVITRNTAEQPAEQLPGAFTPEETPLPAAPRDYNMQGTDLMIVFGEARNIDDFERGSSGFGINAGLNEDEGMRIIALNNRISLEPKKNNGWLSWRLRPPAIRDGAAEMEFSISTCARGDRTGLIMHAPDYGSGHGYYFSLACEGTVSILKDSDILGTADAQAAFKNSSGDSNILTAVVLGNTLTAILNGDVVLSVQDSDYAEGYSGFFTAPQNQDTLTMDILTFRSYFNQ